MKPCNLQQSIESLARQFQDVARDVEELKKGKGSATIEQRVGDNLGEIHSPHLQRPYDNVPPYGYYDMPVQKSYPFYESGYQRRQPTRGGRRGDLGGRGYNRPQEEVPRHETWHEDNMFEDYGENPNVGQAYYGGYYEQKPSQDKKGLQMFFEDCQDLKNYIRLIPHAPGSHRATSLPGS
ncbi:hypothetical protein M9H77_03090 [Catharanthus roseus]|uniref:Uncharacterized protein n=1 Tax=Catharanthus roseus TaxID=4058 RepID=A0ACC0CA83_CATRO|nr:hypothetical protein M9H77_03090 [Catharanthus roseus]